MGMDLVQIGIRCADNCPGIVQAQVVAVAQKARLKAIVRCEVLGPGVEGADDVVTARRCSPHESGDDCRYLLPVGEAVQSPIHDNEVELVPPESIRADVVADPGYAGFFRPRSLRVADRYGRDFNGGHLSAEPS